MIHLQIQCHAAFEIRSLRGTGAEAGDFKVQAVVLGQSWLRKPGSRVSQRKIWELADPRVE